MNDSVVKPENTVVYHTKSGNYVYLTAAKNYLKDRKYNENKRICIGRLLDDAVHMKPNKNYFKYCAEEGELPPAPERDDSLRSGLYLAVEKTMEESGLSDIMEEYGEEDAALMKDIIMYMIGSESDVMQYFPEFGKENVLFSDRVHEDTEISELLNRLSKTQHEAFLQEWNRAHNDIRHVYISYDSTNMNTVADGIEMAEFGPAKDDPDIPDVNYSLAYDQDHGIPCFYELYHGSIIDNSQCRFMVDRAKSFGYENIGFIFDRGYFSRGNIKYCDDNNYALIIMAKGNAKFVSGIVEEQMTGLKLMRAPLYLSEHEVFGITVKEPIFEGDKKRWVHVYYDGARANGETVAYLSQLKKTDEELQKKLDQKLNRREDLRAYEKIYTLKFDENGYFKEFTRKKKAIQNHLDHLGFFVIITSEEMTASEALTKYRHRDSIEKLFRADKAFLGMNALRVGTDAALETKALLSFIAIIVRNDMFSRLKPLYQKDRKKYTVPSAIRILQSLKINKLPDGKYHQMYALTKRQKAILGVYGITPAEYRKSVGKINSELSKISG